MQLLQIEVKTPSRLHFGLIDLNGELGRIDGGVGVALEEPGWSILVSLLDENSPSSKLDVKGPVDPLVASLTDMYFDRRAIQKINYKIKINSSIPTHVGLGSKTQLSLAIGTALEILHTKQKVVPPINSIASLMQRGGTSGIGVSSFANGKFTVDCGHAFGPGKQKENFLPSSASRAIPPPVVTNISFPNEWKVVLAVPNNLTGVSGEKEIQSFQKNCPIDAKDVEKLSRTVLMQMIPAVMEKDYENFGKSLKMFQEVGFKKHEILLQDPIVGKLMKSAERENCPASGMSSFGPTTFCVVEGEKAANDIQVLWQSILDSKMGGSVLITSVNNSGANTRIN